MEKEINQPKRVNDILLGPLERPALHWLAAHMPARVTPDTCTVIGIVGAVITFVGYGLSNIHPGFLWLASLGFFVNWFGDSLDGTLARYRRIERPLYGYFVDHTTDAVTQVLIFCAIGHRLGEPIQAISDGPVLQVFFADQPPTNWRDCLKAESKRAVRFGHELIRRGVYCTPGGKLYLSLAHSDDDIAEILTIAEVAGAATRNRVL